MEQDIINWIIAGFAAVVGFLVRTLWGDVNRLSDKVVKVEVLVAGSYVKREEFDRVMLRIFEKLDNIESQIGNKVDR